MHQQPVVAGKWDGIAAIGIPSINSHLYDNMTSTVSQAIDQSEAEGAWSLEPNLDNVLNMVENILPAIRDVEFLQLCVVLHQVEEIVLVELQVFKIDCHLL